MEGHALAVYAPRQAGQHRIAELQRGSASVLREDGSILPGTPSLVVKFEVPDAIAMVKAEHQASEALHHIRKSAASLARYGFSEAGVKEDDVPALARLVTAIETAVALFRDWNFAEVVDGAAVKVELNPINIGRLMEDANIRAAWSAHLDQASPLERAEGNVYAASPNGSSAEAAKPVEAAPN